jgi:hypothetical protein
MSRGFATALVMAVLAAGGSAAAAQSAALDPNWPCQAIKIDHMSLATMWAGPPLDKFLNDWRNYPAAAELAEKLAQRRVPIDAAKQQIEDFAKTAGPDRANQLLAVMGGLFSLLDQERFEVIEGLDRFGARQKGYAAQIRAESGALGAAQDAKEPDAKTVQTLSNKVYWDMQVFDRRRQMISYACDVPDEIEHRLFELAGTVANLLP